MSKVIGVDIGGTFTDLFMGDEEGGVISTKVPTTYPDFGLGVLSAVDALAGRLGCRPEEVLADASHFCHGTTAALNALVTGSVARVGFITTRGHRDSIFIMNLEGRYAGLDPDAIQNITATRKPSPLVSKRRVKEVTERVDYKGSIVVALDEAEARAAIAELIADGVEAIAISLLWSFSNPAHEERLRELVQEQAPDLYVGLSCETSPRIREYARSATTIMNAQVGPTLRKYLQPLERGLAGRGLRGPLLVMQGSGGTIAAADAPKQAITTVGSVLTGGLVGAATLGERLGHRNIISTDIGGTTFLVGLIVDGEPLFSTGTTLNQFRINVPMMKVTSIGSGGGAIAWIDAGGNLKVGPRSAGSRPGPACWAEGGEEPTVTDANLVLGILNPDFYLGGQKQLDAGAAREAIERRIGKPLGMTAEQAAAAIFEVQNAQTGDLVRSVVVQAGYDPRGFVLYAFGGGGPTHCFAYGAELGIAEIYVPLGDASAFSAYGLTTADVVISAETSAPANYPVEAAVVQRTYEQLEGSLLAKLDQQGVDFREVSLRREADLRFTLQMFEVPTPVKGGELSAADLDQVVDAFEAKYRSLFGAGTGYRQAGVQFISYRVFATGHVPFKPRLATVASANGTPADVARKEDRSVLLDSRRGRESTHIYDYRRLAAGHVLTGPAIVEAPSTTAVLPAGTRGTIDQLGNMVIELGEAAS